MPRGLSPPPLDALTRVYKGSVERFVEAVFDHPTLAECYETAALDGLNRLDSWQTAAPAPVRAQAE